MAGKSLGTLTLDLIARVGGFVQGMDKAERSSEKWRKQVEKDAKVVGNAIGVAGAAVVTSLVAMTVATVKQAQEITKFAALSGTTNEAFQKYAAGAKAVGVEQEKLADIFKDTSDKVGDFLQTGGGPLKDFFENIAPRVGVTADQFRKLSGPEALGLYVASLEKAGASQNEMTFYMEAIASDATLLLPLLKNNAEGFKSLGDAAGAAGAVMDEQTIRAANELAAATLLADQAMAGMKNQIMSGMMPVLADLADEFFSVATNTGIAEEAGDTFGVMLKGAAAIGMGAYAAFQLVGKSIAALAAGFAAADLQAEDFLLGPVTLGKKLYDQQDAILNALSVGFEDVEKSALEYGEVINGIMAAGEEGAKNTGSRVQELADLLEQSKAASQSAGIVIDHEEKKKSAAAKKTVDAIGQQISALERAAKVWGMSAGEVEIYDLRAKGATETQIKYAQSLIDTVDGLERQKKAQEAYADVISTLRTEEEQRTDTLREQLAVINAMGDAGDQSQRTRAVAAAFEDVPEFAGVTDMSGGYAGEMSKYDDAEKELADWNAAQIEMLRQLREEKLVTDEEYNAQELEIRRQHEDALSAISRSRMQTGLQATSDFLGQIAALRDTDSKKGKALAKTAAIAQATISAYTAATNAYASASAIPVVGWVLGPVAAGVALAAGMANVAAIKGQAHDGIMSVPSSGTWNLEKGERVLPQDTAATLDKTLANIQYGRGSAERGSRSSVPVVQNINVSGRPDNRTASQIARESARQQRVAQSRHG